MNFLIDNHPPNNLVPWLQSKGHVATHVRSLQMNRTPDAIIWQYAVEHNRVIITKDEDFANIALLRPEPVPIVWLHIGNCRKQALLASLENVWLEIEQKLSAGEQIVEVY